MGGNRPSTVDVCLFAPSIGVNHETIPKMSRLNTSYSSVIYHHPRLVFDGSKVPKEESTVRAVDDVSVGELLLIEHVLTCTSAIGVEILKSTPSISRLVFPGGDPEAQFIMNSIPSKLKGSKDLCFGLGMTSIKHGCAPNSDRVEQRAFALVDSSKHSDDPTAGVFFFVYSIQAIAKGAELRLQRTIAHGHDDDLFLACKCKADETQRAETYHRNKALALDSHCAIANRQFVERVVSSHWQSVAYERRVLLQILARDGLNVNFLKEADDKSSSSLSDFMSNSKFEIELSRRWSLLHDSMGSSRGAIRKAEEHVATTIQRLHSHFHPADGALLSPMLSEPDC